MEFGFTNKPHYAEVVNVVVNPIRWPSNDQFFLLLTWTVEQKKMILILFVRKHWLLLLKTSRTLVLYLKKTFFLLKNYYLFFSNFSRLCTQSVNRFNEKSEINWIWRKITLDHFNGRFIFEFGIANFILGTVRSDSLFSYLNWSTLCTKYKRYFTNNEY